jgi:hypothetical protein
MMDKYRAYLEELRKRERKLRKDKAKFIKIKYVPYNYYQKSARDHSSYMLDNGYYSNQTWGALTKAWNGFYAARRLRITFDMIKYAKIIQRLEKELGEEVKDFPTLGLYYTGQAIDDEELESDDIIKEKCNARFGIDDLTDSDSKDEENEDYNFTGNFIVFN